MRQLTRSATLVLTLVAFGLLVQSVQASVGASGPSRSWVNVEVLSFDGESITARIILSVAGNHENASVRVWGEIFTSKDEKTCVTSPCFTDFVTVSVGRLIGEVSFSSDTNITTFRYAARFASTYQLTNAFFGAPVFPFDKHQLSLSITTDFETGMDMHDKILVLPSANYEGSYRVSSPSMQDGQYAHKLTLEIQHSSEFVGLMFILNWGTVFLLAILAGVLIMFRRRDEPQAISDTITVCSAVIVFIPIFELAMQTFKSPLAIVLSDLLLFFLLIPNVYLLVGAIRRRGKAGSLSKALAVSCEPNVRSASVRLDPHVLTSEEHALASFDLVYFLLIPALFFVVGRLQNQIRLDPISSGIVLLVFPSAVVSLPFGVHATFSGSVGGRTRAWAIFTFLSSYSIGAALLLYPVSYVVPWLFPLIITFPDPELIWISYALSLWWVGMGIGSTWMRWIYQTFLRRVPSRGPEIEGALNYPVLRHIHTYLKWDWKQRVWLIILGLLAYLVFFILYWMQRLGWKIP